MASTDPLEAAILQGVDARNKADDDDRGPQARASALADRTASSTPNTDDELGSDLPSDHDDEVGASDHDGRPSRTAPSRLSSQLGAANTGPKGVINDHKLQALQARAERADRVAQTNRQMEKMSFQAETWQQQEARERREAKLRQQRENLDSDDDDGAAAAGSGVSAAAIANLQAKERRREQRIAELRATGKKQSKRFSFHGTVANGATAAVGTGGADRWFGHLREVDQRGYVAAIDREDPDVPVVIHIYSKAVEACALLTYALSSLARTYPRTKFLQVPASAIGFGGTSTGDEEDEDDEYAREERAIDVLPTLLVYRGGKLVANLVRVDLDEAWHGGDEKAVRDLLARYDALLSADDRPARRPAQDSGDDDSDT